MESTLIEEGVEAVFKKLGTVKAIKFFQSMGINKGDSVKELKNVTSKLSREEVIKLMKKARK